MLIWTQLKKILFFVTGFAIAAVVLGISSSYAYWPTSFRNSAVPRVVTLTTVTSESDEVVASFSALVDDTGDLVGMRYDDNDPKTETRDFSFEDLRHGVYTNPACEIWAPEVDPRFGGDVNLVLLYNGLSGAKRLFTVSLQKNAHGTWDLSFENRGLSRSLDHLHFNVRKLAFQPIGIKSVEIRQGKRLLSTVDLEDLPEIDR